MDRRSFIRLTTAGSAAGIIAPTAVLASAPMAGAGGLFYTKDAPGRWSKKVGLHLPIIEVSGKTIQVTNKHPMQGFQHYIVKHMVMDKDFNFIDEYVFDPENEKPVSTFDLGSYSGPIHVSSFCNLHDNWLNIAEV